MSHIDKLECRVNKQRCWLTLVTIVVVAVLAFAAGFMAGRCCGKQCGGPQQPNCPPGAMNCGPMNGPACGPGGPKGGSGGMDCCPLGNGGKPSQSMSKEVRVNLMGGPGSSNGGSCIPGFSMLPGGAQFSGTVVIDRDGNVQTFKIGPDGMFGDDDDSDDNDDNDDDDGDDDSDSRPMSPPTPPTPPTP